MAKINARDWIFEVDETGDGTTWTEIGELTTFTVSNTEGEETVDTTVFASQGNAESQAMQRGASLNVEGFKDPDDTGQTAAEALAEKVGEASLGGVRFMHKDDTEWTKWTAWASLGDNGGGNNDKTSWSVSFTRSGPATTEAVV